MPQVEGHLSDLFFNHDNEQARKPDHLGGGFDMDLLVESADDFLATVKGVVQANGGNPTLLPTADDLAEDFVNRL